MWEFIKFTVQTLNAQLLQRYTDHQRIHQMIWLNNQQKPILLMSLIRAFDLGSFENVMAHTHLVHETYTGSLGHMTHVRTNQMAATQFFSDQSWNIHVHVLTLWQKVVMQYTGVIRIYWDIVGSNRTCRR